MKRSSRSGLFLMELIFAIVFFSVASATCAQLFASAHLTSSRSGDLTVAAAIVQQYAETFKEDAEALIQEGGGDATLGTFHQTFFGPNGESLGPEETPAALYKLVFTFAKDGELRSGTFSVFKLSNIPGEYSDPLCTVTASSYTAGEITV